jgi:hypothetical protein
MPREYWACRERYGERDGRTVHQKRLEHGRHDMSFPKATVDATPLAAE